VKLHVRDACTYCGSRRAPLREIVFHGTGQPALRCADVIACVRRQARRKRIRLEGSPLPRRLVADETYFKRGAA
jgi:alpha-D-ribose 1-methylphosphonate 5-phosphate C-P lyase